MSETPLEDSADLSLPPSWSGHLFRLVPAFDSLRKYSLRVLTLDAMAGLTVAAVAVPQAMAYAQIAGIPPQYGLYTAIVMTAVGALFDSSKQLINGPTNAVSIATLSAVAAFSEDQRISAVILLAFLVGAAQIGITLLRLGDLTRYVSHAVIVGFTVGASTLLVLDQLKNLLGVAARGTGEDHFLKRFWLTVFHIDETNGPSLGVGLATIAVAVLLQWLNRRYRLKLPAFLLSIIFAATLVWAFALDKEGVRIVGDIPGALPTFALPQIEWFRVHELASSSLAIALLGLLEAMAMAKAIANHTGQKLDMNQQCLSEGLANFVGSLFHCMPGSGSLTRSNINHVSGARTQWSGVISAVVVALTMALFARYAYYIPRSGLAGILMLTAYKMINRRELLFHMRATPFDAWIVSLTALSAVAISVEFCVLIGVFLSFALYVPQAARVHMTELTVAPERVIRERISTDPVCNRIRIYSLEGELFFGAAQELEQHLDTILKATRQGVRVVVLRLKRARNVDAVCLTVLDRFITKTKAAGVTVLLCGLRPDMVKVLDSSGLLQRLGSKNVFLFEETGAVWSSTLDAVRFAYETVGNDVCENCPRHAPSLSDKDGWYFMI